MPNLRRIPSRATKHRPFIRTPTDFLLVIKYGVYVNLMDFFSLHQRGKLLYGR
jgi:hypothetical protein